ncbi:SRR1-like protein [Frankliniella occidentalis]|uniref:SRR1-like protein n=1 Tax=Frankliniella occidentalis TaxID=133901 RepID=A0A6J1T869_FRAOC|nr:SRR1-like protein [Frankliniella occidentalis]XP_026287866.1 SRR1-like protein [Frankliniella occidentalis]
MSCDEFKLVTSRRRGKKVKRVAVACSHNKQGETDISVNVKEEILKINHARTVVNESPFTEGVKNVLQEALDVCGTKSVSEIICYGLGHFTECTISRYQLALLLTLQERFKATVHAHDPVFYVCELNILKELGFFIIEENEEGKRLLNTPDTTLLYLPHCPKQLVNNFLWKNWGPTLSKCIIFGNSISSAVDRSVLSDCDLTAFLVKIQPYINEFPIVNNFKFLDVFNDTSVHVFPEDKLCEVLPSFWSENCLEPVYPDSDLELIIKKQ